VSGSRATLLLVFGMVVAGALQQSMAWRLEVFGARPDFLLLALGLSSLYLRRAGGTLAGFAAGLVQGALGLSNLAHYVISRSVAGFIGSWSNAFGFAPGPLTAAAFVAALTAGSQGLLMLLAPPPDIAPFVGDTIRTAMYNGVLAVPLYALLERFLRRPTR
jgi:cell shape-determining protein MreD